MIIKTAIEHLQSYPPQTPCAIALWLPSDVKSRAEERRIKLTEKQIDYVLYYIEQKQDASIGINWDVLDFWIDEMKAKEAK